MHLFTLREMSEHLRKIPFLAERKTKLSQRQRRTSPVLYMLALGSGFIFHFRSNASKIRSVAPFLSFVQFPADNDHKSADLGLWHVFRLANACAFFLSFSHRDASVTCMYTTVVVRKDKIASHPAPPTTSSSCMACIFREIAVAVHIHYTFGRAI